MGIFDKIEKGLDKGANIVGDILGKAGEAAEGWGEKADKWLEKDDKFSEFKEKAGPVTEAAREKTEEFGVKTEEYLGKLFSKKKDSNTASGVNVISDEDLVRPDKVVDLTVVDVEVDSSKLPEDAFDTFSVDLTPEEIAHIEERLAKEKHTVPTVPGEYLDKTGDLWILDSAGNWTDRNGLTRSSEYAPLFVIFGPMVPAETKDAKPKKKKAGKKSASKKSSKTLVELKAEAKSLNIKGYSGLKKDELVKVIKKAKKLN